MLFQLRTTFGLIRFKLLLGLLELPFQVLVLFYRLLSSLLGIEKVLLLEGELLFKILCITKIIAAILRIFSGCLCRLTKHFLSDGQGVVRLKVQDAPFTEFLVALQFLETFCLRLYLVGELAHE